MSTLSVALRARTFRSLRRHYNYRLFFAGQLISLIGTWMQQVAQSWLIYRLTHSALLLGAGVAVAGQRHARPARGRNRFAGGGGNDYIQAANNGITSITKLVQSAQALVRSSCSPTAPWRRAIGGWPSGATKSV